MLTCIRSKRQRDAAEYALRTIQSSCIRPYIKTIYLYGSCARGEEKYSSDVDLFLELSESFRSRPELKKYLYLLKSEAPTMVILTPMSVTVHLQKAPVKIPFITSTNFKNPQTPPRNYPHPLSLTRRLCICYTFCTIPG